MGNTKSVTYSSISTEPTMFDRIDTIKELWKLKTGYTLCILESGMGLFLYIDHPRYNEYDNLIAKQQRYYFVYYRNADNEFELITIRPSMV